MISLPVYKYTAMTKSGDKTESTYTANSETEVLAMLRDSGHFPIKVQEMVEKKEISLGDIFNKVKTKDIAIFCRQFYTMLNAGVTIVNCLDILRHQTENKKLRKVIGDVYEDVQKGLTLSEALKKHKKTFPSLFINMVEAGELSGTLDTVMNRMATHYEKEYKINNKIKGAMVYPIILSIVAIGVVIFLLTFVMPTFMGMFTGSGVELPWPTKILLSISDWLQSYWYIFIGALLILIVGLGYYGKTDNGRFIIDNMKLKIPVVKNTSEKVITSRFTRTLSTLLVSGVPLIDALEIVSKVVNNKVVEKKMNSVKEEVQKGASLSKPVKNTGVFPPMVDSMIEIGEESGSLDDILDRTANFYDEEVETAIQKMTTMLEPIMIVVMAVIIGFIVIAMALPMFDMVNTVEM
ncbi:type II secretion system F family protein [Dethiothermospora halolimnae]|uniref:type II secretion system F family protein n=1 Tax=Dethiothermospora halolimnae TaxID=3114390 RepID=UPI003CCBFA8F